MRLFIYSGVISITIKKYDKKYLLQNEIIRIRCIMCQVAQCGTLRNKVDLINIVI
jgi:hypothetical protein